MDKREAVARALRRLNVVAYDEAPDAQMYATGFRELEQAIADLNDPGWGGCALTFTAEGPVPAQYQRALVDLLAFRLASEFQRPPSMDEITAMMRIRAVNRPYVRDMDLDEDGIVTDEEIEAIDRSRFY